MIEASRALQRSRLTPSRRRATRGAAATVAAARPGRAASFACRSARTRSACVGPGGRCGGAGPAPSSPHPPATWLGSNPRPSPSESLPGSAPSSSGLRHGSGEARQRRGGNTLRGRAVPCACGLGSGNAAAAAARSAASATWSNLAASRGRNRDPHRGHVPAAAGAVAGAAAAARGATAAHGPRARGLSKRASQGASAGTAAGTAARASASIARTAEQRTDRIYPTRSDNQAAATRRGASWEREGLLTCLDHTLPSRPNRPEMRAAHAGRQVGRAGKAARRAVERQRFAKSGLY